MSIEAMRLALEALEKNYVLINGTERFLGLDQIKDTYYAGCFDVDGINKQTNDAITALRAAIEQPEQGQWDAIPDAFNEWWNADYDDSTNPFRLNSPAYWAWAGWSAANKEENT